MRVIIHVGSGKTGTTSVQEALANSSEHLESHAYFYPVIDRTPNHNYLAAPFKQTSLRRMIQRNGTLQKVRQAGFSKWELVRTMVAEKQPRTLVLSAEFLFMLVDVPAFMDCLHRNVPGIKTVDIVAYLRRPSAYYLSRAQQQLKGSPVFAAPSRQPYAEHIAAWSDFGDVHLAEFDRKFLADGDIVRDFWQRYLPGLACPFAPGGVSENVSLSAESLSLLQKYWLRWFPDSHDMFPSETVRLQKLLGQIERTGSESMNITRPRLHENIARILDLPGPEMARLSKDFGFEFEGIPASSASMFEPTLPDQRYELVEDIMRISPETLAALQRRVVAMRTIPLLPAWRQARQVAALKLGPVA
jgi:hypothetical protein